MRQKTQRLLFLLSSMATLLFVGDQIIPLIQPALAATDRDTISTAAPLPGSMQSRRSSVPTHRLMSEGSGPIPLAAPPVPLTAPPAPRPDIGVSSSSFSFSAQQGNSSPTTQTLTVTNRGGGTLNWNAAATAAWLTLSPASGKNTGPITLAAAAGSLAVGTYNTLVTVSASNVASVSIPITLTVTPPSATVSLSPSSLTFSGVQGGGNPASQTVTVNSNGNWTASSNASWLTLSPSSGNGDGSIAASVAISAAAVDTNNATITVTNGGVTRTSSVTFTVSPASLTASPDSVTYTATQGRANPSAQSIAINANGTWSVSGGAPWLSLSPTSGSNNGIITASVNTANATQGNHETTMTVKSGGITKTVIVTLRLDPSSSSSVTLSWSANVESDLAGYRVYRATSSGTYGAPIATIQGNTPRYVATGLQFNTTYFFVVTAYDIAGNESAYSNEVSKSIF